MSRNWTFGRKVAASFTLSAMMVLVVALVGYVNAHRLIENERQVLHTEQVREQFKDLLALLVDAETGQRGFIITGSDAFLEPYQGAVARIGKRIEEIRTFTIDPRVLRKLDAVLPLLDGQLLVLKHGIDQRRNESPEASARTLANGDGKRSMDVLRRMFAEMDETELALLAQRSDEAENSAQSTKLFLLWGSLAGTLAVALIGLFIARSLSRQIGAAVQQVQSSSAELQVAANEQASGAQVQSTAMNEITTTISELLATSRQIADSAQRVSRVAEQTVAAARAGDGTVERGHDAVTGIKRQVEIIVNHMLELGKKSQQIGTVLDIVAELAEQTNILAINATIEAAGAGEAGKRFSVVADEIRKLADRVAGSTSETRKLIEDVRSAVNTTVMTTENGSKAAETGAKQFSEVAMAFQQITLLVTTAAEAAREIELSTKQQATAVAQVNIAMTDVATTSRQTETSSEQTLATASQLASLSRELLRLVQAPANA
jgi:methyl-accepting chemotaxis protein